jgi:hypothetical protein
MFVFSISQLLAILKFTKNKLLIKVINSENCIKVFCHNVYAFRHYQSPNSTSQMLTSLMSNTLWKANPNIWCHKTQSKSASQTISFRVSQSLLTIFPPSCLDAKLAGDTDYSQSGTKSCLPSHICSFFFISVTISQ